MTGVRGTQLTMRPLVEAVLPLAPVLAAGQPRPIVVVIPDFRELRTHSGEHLRFR